MHACVCTNVRRTYNTHTCRWVYTCTTYIVRRTMNVQCTCAEIGSVRTYNGMWKHTIVDIVGVGDVVILQYSTYSVSYSVSYSIWCKVCRTIFDVQCIRRTAYRTVFDVQCVVQYSTYSVFDVQRIVSVFVYIKIVFVM